MNDPLPEYHLNASARSARDIANHLMPQCEMNPPYQRGSVWDVDQQRALVKSWIIGAPIGAIILNDRSTPAWKREMGEDVYHDNPEKIWACVDGQQRMLTAKAWFEDRLDVPSWWFSEDDRLFPDDGWVSYRGLSASRQRFNGHRFLLPVVEAKLPTVQAEAELFLLVNGGGTSQTTADMQRARDVAEG